MRRGLSLTLTYIVVAVILLSVAVTVLLMATGSLDPFKVWADLTNQENRAQIAGKYCVDKKQEYCEQNPGDTFDQWASSTTYNGRSCKEWVEQEEALVEKLDCGDSYS